MAIEISKEILPIIQKTFDLFDHDLGYLRASGKDGVFARPFGRDTMISAHALLKAYELNPEIPIEKIFPAVAFILINTPEKDVPEAGIYRGKPPHEMGTKDQGFPEKFGLMDEATGFGICCDSLDAPDRTLLTIFELEEKFPGKLQKALDNLAKKTDKPSNHINHYIEIITQWAVENTNEFEGSAFIGAAYDPRRDNRNHRGLNKQLWRDSEFSMTKADGSKLTHPLYPAEEQALRWSSLKKAAEKLKKINPDLAEKALKAADLTKQKFNEKFPYQDSEGKYIASAVDKTGYKVKDVTCDEITLLSHRCGQEYFIQDPDLRKNIITRSYRKLFDSLGGFRTIDRLNHPGNIYHGPDSIWPHRQADIVFALDEEVKKVKDPLSRNQYEQMAKNIAEAALKPIAYYDNPVELVIIKNNSYDLFRTYCQEFDRYQESSRVQAFSGFSALYLTEYLKNR